MIKELIKMRPADKFIFVVRKENPENKVLRDFFNDISNLPNFTIVYDRLTTKQTNFLFLIGLGHLAALRCNADVYLSCDIISFGRKNYPIINLIADFSSINNNESSTLNSIGKFLRRKQYKVMVKNAAHIVAISNYTLNILRSKTPAVIDKSSLIYNGIDDVWFSTGNVIHKQLNKDPYFLWWGHISARKNVEGLLQAYRMTFSDKKDNDFPKLLIVSNNYEPLHLKYITDTFIQNNVLFRKSVELPELINLVDNCSGVVFPSFYEGFGLPAIEAFARGKQVLTSNVTALQEVTQNKAIYCSPNDVASISAGLYELFKNPDLKSNSDERKVIARQYTYQNAAMAFSKIITAIK
jgi:glycosyltransferase involved in cell wall biosynthesis